MEAVKLFDKKDVPLDWEYDGEADTLYISFGKPRAALGVDVGEGVVVRYDVRSAFVPGTARGRQGGGSWQKHSAYLCSL
ncbi:MAG: DUF2283 domain-containing protein [Deltaproteobacteria bacterium]|nr:DUF2283 domain-containing protein [Deltaproteobacteria bacterium]MBI2210440.1 DUF2283 domain-containing protein [Deltaproteobacteria bacterium]